MAGVLAVATPERLQLIDFTTAISIQQYAMTQPMPNLQNHFFASIQPFQPLVTIKTFF